MTPSRREQIALIGLIVLLGGLVHIIATELGGGVEDPAFNQLIWASVYLYAAYELFHVRQRLGRALWETWPLVALLALSMSSVFWSAEPALTLRRSTELVGTTLIAYYIACRFELADFLRCYVYATAISAALSIVAIVAAPSIGVMQEQYAGAWQGIYGQKNVLGAAMSVGLIAVMALLPEARGGRRAWFVVLAGAFLVLLIGSRSASSVLIMVVMTGIYGIVALLRSRRWRSWAAYGLVAIPSCFALVASLTNVSAGTILQATGRDSTLTGRTDIWPYAVQAISDRPLLGWGYKAFWVTNGPVEQYLTDDYLPVKINDGDTRLLPGDDWLPFHAHDGYLEIALDVGLCGAALFFFLLIVSVGRGFRLAGRASGVRAVWPLLVMIYFAIANITEASIGSYNTFEWVIFVTAAVYVTPSIRLPCVAAPRATRNIV